MRTNCLIPAWAIVFAASVACAEKAENYKIDSAHSSTGFKIRHFFSRVSGEFKEFQGTMVVDRDDMTKSKVEATIQAASIDTNHADRDKHLRNADFFDTGKFPTITFKSTAWKQVDKDTYDVTGDLTLRDVTKPVTLRTKFMGAGPDGWGGHRTGWEATTTIDRTAFGVSWNKAIEGGGVVLGNDVEITLNIEAVRQP